MRPSRALAASKARAAEDAKAARRDAEGPAGLLPPLPPSCTDWTRLVLLPVLTGHVRLRARQAALDAADAKNAPHAFPPRGYAAPGLPPASSIGALPLLAARAGQGPGAGVQVGRRPLRRHHRSARPVLVRGEGRGVST